MTDGARPALNPRRVAHDHHHAGAAGRPALDLSRVAQDLQIRKVHVENVVQLLDVSLDRFVLSLPSLREPSLGWPNHDEGIWLHVVAGFLIRRRRWDDVWQDATRRVWHPGHCPEFIPCHNRARGFGSR